MTNWQILKIVSYVACENCGLHSYYQNISFTSDQLTYVQLAAITGPAGSARTVVPRRQVRTCGVVLTRISFALVDVLVAVLAGPPQGAVARVTI